MPELDDYINATIGSGPLAGEWESKPYRLIQDLVIHAKHLEFELRRLMWSEHGHDGLYGDYGEMQCGKCLKIGCGDYRRAPMDKVREAFILAKSTRQMPTGT